MKKKNSKGQSLLLVILLIIVLLLAGLLLWLSTRSSSSQESTESTYPAESSAPQDSEPESESTPESFPSQESEESSELSEPLEESETESQTAPVDPDDPSSLASQILSLLKAQDLDGLQSFVSSQGLRLCPFGSPDSTNKVLKATEVTSQWLTSTREHLFGVYPGSGADMIMTAAEYYAEFLWPVDFIQEAKVIQTDSSLISSFSSYYPDAHYITYYADDIFEWKELTLILLPEDNQNKLCALVFRDARAE